MSVDGDPHARCVFAAVHLDRVETGVTCRRAMADSPATPSHAPLGDEGGAQRMSTKIGERAGTEVGVFAASAGGPGRPPLRDSAAAPKLQYLAPHAVADRGPSRALLPEAHVTVERFSLPHQPDHGRSADYVERGDDQIVDLDPAHAGARWAGFMGVGVRKRFDRFPALLAGF